MCFLKKEKSAWVDFKKVVYHAEVPYTEELPFSLMSRAQNQLRSLVLLFIIKLNQQPITLSLSRA